LILLVMTPIRHMTTSVLSQTTPPAARKRKSECHVVLICNFPYDRQESILRYGEMLYRALEEFGMSVSIVQPQAAILSRMSGVPASIAKWIGYIDKFILFPQTLKKLEGQFSERVIYHIVDHGNAPYLEWLRHRPHVVTCHDALAIRSALQEIPENQTSWSGRIFQKWILRNLRSSSMVACVSSQTEHEVRRLTGLRSERTMVIPHALNYPFRPMRSEEAAAILAPVWTGQGIARPSRYFFHVGGTQWYKNREGVIDIFANLRKKHPDAALVIAGKPNTREITQKLIGMNCQDQVHYVGEVTSEELNALYSEAEALLFPSLAEGFGWPIIEAQAAGCPVFTTGRPPMTDIGGEAARYFEPSDVADAARIVDIALLEREKIVQQGFENAARYSLDTMIGSYMRLYETVLSRWPKSV